MSKGKKTLKREVREAVGEAVGEAVKIGDILGGTTGPLVEAQGEVAEADVEEFIDRLDGKG